MMRGRYRTWQAAMVILSATLAIVPYRPAVSSDGETDSGGFPRSRPNIVMILADDLGYGDLSCYGHPQAKTPVIDGLARDGVRFTQHYSNGPECSPTRTAFLTGRYQQRAGGLECAIGTGNVGRYDDAIRLADAGELGLPAGQTVIPGALNDAGYVCGVFGKWHLGYEPKFNPVRHSWNSFFGYMGGNVHYFTHRETSDLHVLFRNQLPVYRDGYMTHLITDESVAFVKANQDRPFFLYVSHECPHFPFQGPGDVEKDVNVDNWMDVDQAAYVSMLEDLDTEVGRLLQAIDDAGLTDNTLIIFVSDNGGFDGAAHMNDLRGAKGTTFEGGIRVPLIVRWPKRIPPNTTSDQVCVTFDLTRSILQLAGATSGGQDLDGDDIVQHVVSGASDYKRTLFWRGRRGDRTWKSVRDGDHKYVHYSKGNDVSEWLFDLSTDRAESTDLLSLGHDTKSLKRQLETWEREVQAKR